MSSISENTKSIAVIVLAGKDSKQLKEEMKERKREEKKKHYKQSDKGE